MRHGLLPSAWLAGVLAVLYGSSLGNPYLEGRVPLNQQGRLEFAFWFVVAVTVECLVIWVVLRPRTYRRSWGRALSALLVLLAFLVLFAMTAMHAPTVWFFHIYWLALGGVVLFVLFVLAVVGTLRVRSSSDVARQQPAAHARGSFGEQ